MERLRICPPPFHLLPQAIHMASIAAKTNQSSYTILINTDPIGTNKQTPLLHNIKTHTLSPKYHLIYYSIMDHLPHHMINNPYIKPSHSNSLHIPQNYCTGQHLNNTTITWFPSKYTTSYPNCTTHTTTYQVQIHKTWHTLTDPPPLLYTYNNTNPLSNYTFAFPLKFPPKHSYYTNGSPNNSLQITGDLKLLHMESMALSKTYKYQSNFLGSKIF